MPEQSFPFSLRIVFIVLAFLSAVLSLLVAPSTWFVGLVEIVLVAAIPAFAIVCAASFAQRVRAFWIGIAMATALPAASYIIRFLQTSRVGVIEDGRSVGIVSDFLWGLRGSADWFTGVILFWAVSLAVGSACVLLHTLLFPRRSARRERRAEICAPLDDPMHLRANEPANDRGNL